MGVLTLLGGGALKELLRLSPQIITTAEQLYSTVSRNRRAGAAESPVLSRLDRMEGADVAQAELLEQMAGQIRSLTTALEQLTSRTKELTILAGGAGLLAVVSLILVLVRWS